jgi:hypothetical protein
MEYRLLKGVKISIYTDRNVHSECIPVIVKNKNILDPGWLRKKSLKLPKGQSEFVYQRRTDNTMDKRKSTKEQTTIYKVYI